MYAVIRNYEDEAADVIARLREHAASLREVMSGIDGFRSYYLLDTGDGGVATVSVYDDRAGAEESTRAAGKWLRETGLADALPNPPTILQGEVAINARVGRTRPPPTVGTTVCGGPDGRQSTGLSGSCPIRISLRRHAACPAVGSGSSPRSARTRSTTRCIVWTSDSVRSVRRLPSTPSTARPVGVPTGPIAGSESTCASSVANQSRSSREVMLTSEWNSSHRVSST